jgi:hypothetical protein
LVLLAKKAASAAESEAGMDCGTALAAAHLRTSTRAGAEGPSRREKRLAIWIRLQAPEKPRFAEEGDLEFASPGFEFPS